MLATAALTGLNSRPCCGAVSTVAHCAYGDAVAENFFYVQVLQEGIPSRVVEADKAWKPSVPVREMRKMQLQAQQKVH